MSLAQAESHDQKMLITRWNSPSCFGNAPFFRLGWGLSGSKHPLRHGSPPPGASLRVTQAAGRP